MWEEYVSQRVRYILYRVLVLRVYLSVTGLPEATSAVYFTCMKEQMN